jgi:hypothetical protein
MDSTKDIFYIKQEDIDRWRAVRPYEDSSQLISDNKTWSQYRDIVYQRLGNKSSKIKLKTGNEISFGRFITNTKQLKCCCTFYYLEHSVFNIAYWVDVKYRRKNESQLLIVTSLQVMKTIFRQNLKIVALINVRNLASLSVIKKLNFTRLDHNISDSFNKSYVIYHI